MNRLDKEKSCIAKFNVENDEFCGFVACDLNEEQAKEVMDIIMTSADVGFTYKILKNECCELLKGNNVRKGWKESFEKYADEYVDEENKDDELQRAYRATLAKANISRSLLYMRGFLSESENEKVHKRIMKFKEEKDIEITEAQLDSADFVYNDNNEEL